MVFHVFVISFFVLSLLWSRRRRRRTLHSLKTHSQLTSHKVHLQRREHASQVLNTGNKPGVENASLLKGVKERSMKRRYKAEENTRCSAEDGGIENSRIKDIDTASQGLRNDDGVKTMSFGRDSVSGSLKRFGEKGGLFVDLVFALTIVLVLLYNGVAIQELVLWLGLLTVDG